MTKRARVIFDAIIATPAVRQSVMITAGTSVAALIMSVAMIIVSRVLGPENFGVFSVGISLMGLFTAGTHLGVNQLIPRFANRWRSEPKKISLFLSYIILIKIVLSTILFFAILFTIPLITQTINFPHPGIVFWALIGALGISLYEHVYLTLSAHHSFLRVNLLNIVQALAKSAGFFIVLIVLKLGLLEAAITYFLAPGVVSALCCRIWRKQTWSNPGLATSAIRKSVHHFFGHGVIAIFAMTLINNIDLLFVQRSLSSFDTGIYAGAGRIAMFVGFITSSVGGVLMNRVSRYKDRRSLQSYLLKSLSVAAVSLLGFCLFLPFAQLTIFYSIGPEYLSGTFPLILLILNAFLSLAVVPYTAFFYAVDYPLYFSFGGVLQATIIVVGNLLFLQPYGLEAAALSRLFATLAYILYTMVFILYTLQKQPKLGPSKIGKLN